MNVLGGYQKINLSTADLTASTLSVEGLSKACANANGKAALVKMPDGTEAFGAVKEVTGGYQLSAMGADSKVSRLDVDDTDDTFTMKESGEIAGAITGGPDSVTTLDTTKASLASPFVAPSDGYIRVENSTNAADTTTGVGIPMASGSNMYVVISNIPAAGATTTRLCFFVPKGCPIAINALKTGSAVVFIPLLKS